MVRVVTNNEYLIHIAVDNKEVKGNSKISGFTGWFDGETNSEQMMNIHHNMIDFNMPGIFVPWTAELWKVFEKIISHGYGRIDIKTAKRNSDGSKENYAAFTVDYKNCKIVTAVVSEHGMGLTFKARESVGFSVEISAEGVKGTTKFGPSVYNLETNKPE